MENNRKIYQEIEELDNRMDDILNTIKRLKVDSDKTSKIEAEELSNLVNTFEVKKDYLNDWSRRKHEELFPENNAAEEDDDIDVEKIAVISNEDRKLFFKVLYDYILSETIQDHDEQFFPRKDLEYDIHMRARYLSFSSFRNILNPIVRVVIEKDDTRSLSKIRLHEKLEVYSDTTPIYINLEVKHHSYLDYLESHLEYYESSKILLSINQYGEICRDLGPSSTFKYRINLSSAGFDTIVDGKFVGKHNDFKDTKFFMIDDKSRIFEISKMESMEIPQLKHTNSWYNNDIYGLPKYFIVDDSTTSTTLRLFAIVFERHIIVVDAYNDSEIVWSYYLDNVSISEYVANVRMRSYDIVSNDVINESNGTVTNKILGGCRIKIFTGRRYIEKTFEVKGDGGIIRSFTKTYSNHVELYDKSENRELYGFNIFHGNKFCINSYYHENIFKLILQKFDIDKETVNIEVTDIEQILKEKNDINTANIVLGRYLDDNNSLDFYSEGYEAVVTFKNMSEFSAGVVNNSYNLVKFDSSEFANFKDGNKPTPDVFIEMPKSSNGDLKLFKIPDFSVGKLSIFPEKQIFTPSDGVDVYFQLFDDFLDDDHFYGFSYRISLVFMLDQFTDGQAAANTPTNDVFGNKFANIVNIPPFTINSTIRISADKNNDLYSSIHMMHGSAMEMDVTLKHAIAIYDNKKYLKLSLEDIFVYSLYVLDKENQIAQMDVKELIKPHCEIFSNLKINASIENLMPVPREESNIRSFISHEHTGFRKRGDVNNISMLLDTSDIADKYIINVELPMRNDREYYIKDFGVLDKYGPEFDFLRSVPEYMEKEIVGNNQQDIKEKVISFRQDEGLQEPFESGFIKESTHSELFINLEEDNSISDKVFIRIEEYRNTDFLVFYFKIEYVAYRNIGKDFTLYYETENNVDTIRGSIHRTLSYSKIDKEVRVLVKSIDPDGKKLDSIIQIPTDTYVDKADDKRFYIVFD